MGDGLITIDQNGRIKPATVRYLIGRIEAVPEHLTVVKGSKVKYRLALRWEESELKLVWDNEPAAPGPSPAQQQFDKTGRTEQLIPEDVRDKLGDNPTSAVIAPMLGWVAIYDVSQKSGAPPYEFVARSGSEIEVTWKYPGKHVLLVRIGHYAENAMLPSEQLAETHILFTQRVTTEVQTVQRQRLRFAKDRPPPHPLEELDAMTRYIQTVEAAEKERAVPKAKEAEYRKEMEQKRRYRDALFDMFEHHRGKEILYPIIASYVSKNTSEQAELRVCALERWPIKDGKVHYEVTLIDWTSPMDNRLRGRYVGEATTREAAIRAAIKEWRDNCRYYHPGNVVGEVHGWLFTNNQPPPPPLSFSFDTPGKGFWDHVKDFFEAIALVVGFVVLVLTIVTPIPGDEIVAGLIWTSIFSSTVAAGIGIGRRRHNGFDGDMDDVFDALTIVGNVVTAGQLGWARRALLMSRAFQSQFKQMFLFGQITTEAVQGLLIAKEKIDEFESLLSDPNLSPRERVDKVLKLVSSMMLNGAMYYSSVHGSKRGAKHGERPETIVDPAMKARLENPREVVDLDVPKKQKADVSQRELKTKVQDEPQRAKPPQEIKPAKPVRQKRRKFDFQEPPAPEKRGIRTEDDFDFGQQALDSDKIILVRDSNAAAVKHVHDPAKGPKPESLKAKSLKDKPPPTLRNAENAGLAAAHPDDPRLKEMLAEMKSPKTGKPPMSYDEFTEKLKKDGYRVTGPENDYVIVSGTSPSGYYKGYYSDYDLHGVYDRNGRDAYTEAFRGELNGRFGKELVQHGPHDNWPKRNQKEAGPNRGPQPPVTAYVPHNGKVKRYHLNTREEMQAFYEAWDIPWDKIYPPW